MTDNSESLEIIDTVRRKMDRAIIEHGRSLRAMHEMHMGPFDQALFVDTAIGEIDRLTAERDAARKNESRWRERINAIIAIAESYESLAQNPHVETSVSQERLGFAQDIYQALGIESEASE